VSKLVTVVTPTWRRPRTLAEYTIPSVACQTYSPVEHLIVIDGKDADSERVLQENGYSFDGEFRRITYLGRNWTSYATEKNFGVAARLVGSFMAAGDYIAYLDDDNAWMPHHLETLIGILESENVDFVTTSWYMHQEGGERCGWAPPGGTNTDASAILCRADILKKGPSCSWQFDGTCFEGKLMERWIAAGCTWRHRDEPTYIYPRGRFGAPD